MGFLDSLFKGFQNVFGGIGNAVQGAAQGLGGLANKAGQAIGSPMGQKLTQGVMGAFQPKTQTQSGNQKGFQSFQGMAAPLMSSFMQQPGMTGNPPPTGFSSGDSGEAPPAQKKTNTFMDMFQSAMGGGGGNIATGLGVMGLGNMLGGKTEMPSFNTPEVQALHDFKPNSFQSISPEMQQSIQNTLNIQQEQQMKALRDTYKNVRPGTDYTTDSAYQRDLANLQRNQGMTAADAMTNAQSQFNNQQIAANSQEQQKLSELAQLSIGEIMAKTGMEAEEAQQVKQMFGDVGSMFVTKGLFPDAYKSPLDMFGKK